MVSGELRARLEEMALPCVKPAGTVLFRRGDDVSGVFLIEKGKVKLTLGGHRRVCTARELGPGALLGLPATLSGSPYSLTAKVMQDAQLGFIPREAMLDFLRTNPLLCFQITQVLSEEVSEMRAVISSPAYSMRRLDETRARIGKQLAEARKKIPPEDRKRIDKPAVAARRIPADR